MQFADRKTRENWIKNKHIKAFNFYNGDELKEIDIIIESPVSFEEAKKSAILIKAGDLTPPVISIDKLIKMKRRTDRQIDKADIEELKRIKKLRKEL